MIDGRYGAVYCAVNLINNKMYIGKTTNDLPKRIKGHCQKSNKQTYFKRSIMKYEIENFSWSIISYANTLQELDNKEIKLIKKYNTTDSNYGYNLTIGGEGINLTPEQAKFRGISIHNSEKHRKSMRKTKEWALKIKRSRELNGNWIPSECGRKAGWHHSQEAKRKIKLNWNKQRAIRVIRECKYSKCPNKFEIKESDSKLFCSYECYWNCMRNREFNAK